MNYTIEVNETENTATSLDEILLDEYRLTFIVNAKESYIRAIGQGSDPDLIIDIEDNRTSKTVDMYRHFVRFDRDTSLGLTPRGFYLKEQEILNRNGLSSNKSLLDGDYSVFSEKADIEIKEANVLRQYRGTFVLTTINVEYDENVVQSAALKGLKYVQNSIQRANSINRIGNMPE